MINKRETNHIIVRVKRLTLKPMQSWAVSQAKRPQTCQAQDVKIYNITPVFTISL